MAGAVAMGLGFLSGAMLADRVVEIFERRDAFGRVGDGLADRGPDMRLGVEPIGKPPGDELLVFQDRAGIDVPDAGGSAQIVGQFCDEFRLNARARATIIKRISVRRW